MSTGSTARLFSAFKIQYHKVAVLFLTELGVAKALSASQHFVSGGAIEFKFTIQILAMIIVVFSLNSLAIVLENSVPESEGAVAKTELQWVLCENSVASFARKTGSALGSSKSRSIYFLETNDLKLASSGSFLRIREHLRKFKSSAKINFVDDSNLPWNDLKGKDSKCEWDRYNSHQKVGCSLNYEGDSLADVLSEDQKHFLSSNQGFESWSDLKLLGPALSQEWSWTPKHFESDLFLEEVTATGFTSLELSMRVSNQAADKAFANVQNWLNQNHVVLCPVQRGKSETLIRALLAK